MMINQPTPFGALGQSDEPGSLSQQEFMEFLQEAADAPLWRRKADVEMDYRDGNQLSSEILQRMGELGIAPAVVPMIGLAVETAVGDQKKKRTDWRVLSDTKDDDDELADAIGFELNKAERRSNADRAMSQAYESQYAVGLGWVEVTRASDPREFPYTVRNVHRNEVDWDWVGYRESLLGDQARYVIHRKWLNKDVIKLAFPEHADLIEACSGGWTDLQGFMAERGGDPTGLFNSIDQERGWTIEEAYWRDRIRKRLMVYKVQYRRWRRAEMIKLPDNSRIEFDRTNPIHRSAAIRMGVFSAVVSDVRFAWFAGPHKLADFKSPESHNYFTLVPFWGHIEDRTGAPYGRIRNMVFMQDLVNSSLSKMRWGMSSVNVKRTKGAYVGTATQLRNQIARPDCDIVLDRDHMALPGAIFEIDRNYQTTKEHFEMFMEGKRMLRELSGTTPQFAGMEGAETNDQYRAMLEQSAATLASINDHFDEGRIRVGHLLLYMLLDDMGSERTEINIEGGGLRDNRRVVINERAVDPDTQELTIINRVKAQLLRVTLAEVPNTSSFRQQQLLAFSEAFKSTTPEFQALMMPHMIGLMDLPSKGDLLKEMQNMLKQPSLADKQFDLDRRKIEAEILRLQVDAKKIGAQAVSLGVETQFSALQAGAVVAENPDVAPVGDAIMMNAGFEPLGGPDPNIPTPAAPVVGRETVAANGDGAVDVRQNTSPLQPPVPASGKTGIETARFNDNLPR